MQNRYQFRIERGRIRWYVIDYSINVLWKSKSLLKFVFKWWYNNITVQTNRLFSRHRFFSSSLTYLETPYCKLLYSECLFWRFSLVFLQLVFGRGGATTLIRIFVHFRLLPNSNFESEEVNCAGSNFGKYQCYRLSTVF